MWTVHRSSLALVLASALALAPSLALAAPVQTSAVSGRIFAADLKTPAPGLSVQAVPDGAMEPLVQATTDARGRFELQGIPAGRYLLVLYDAQGTALAAAPIVAEKAAMSVTLALPRAGSLAPGQTGETPGDETEAERSGFSAWISSPSGATIALLAGATLIAIGADQLTDDDIDTEEIPASPASPAR